MSTAGWVAGGLTAATLVFGGGYLVSSLYSHDGSEFKIVMNKGEAQSVTSEGLGFAPGWFDKIHSFPRTRQITGVDDADLKLRSADGEEFIGGLRIEYQFTFSNADPDASEAEKAAAEERNKALITKLFRDFSIRDTDVFWDTDQIDPVEKTIKARAQTAAVAVFAELKTDDYQDEIDATRQKIKERLQAIVNAEQLPVKIVEVDTSGVSPHPDVQKRINQIASERRENERSNVIVDNQDENVAAAAAQAAVTLAFTNPLIEAGLSEETVVQLNCLRMLDKNDRLGIPFGMACIPGAANDEAAVAINPSEFAIDQKDAPAVPAPIALEAN